MAIHGYFGDPTLGRLFRDACAIAEANKKAEIAQRTVAESARANTMLKEAHAALDSKISEAICRAQKGERLDGGITVLSAPFQIDQETARNLPVMKDIEKYCKESDIAFDLRLSHISANANHTMVSLKIDLSKPYEPLSKPLRPCSLTRGG